MRFTTGRNERVLPRKLKWLCVAPIIGVAKTKTGDWKSRLKMKGASAQTSRCSRSG